MKTLKSEERISKICSGVASLSASDFKQMEKIIKGQLEYNNPLKQLTTKEQNELGEHNAKILESLKNFHKVIIESMAK